MEGHHLLRGETEGETDEVVPENRQLESSLGPQYGTVATGMGSTRPHRNGPTKRYRLSLLIVMSFDATLLVFLSILSFLTLYKDSKVQSYFTDLSVKTSVFDIVMIAFIRFVVLLLFYLVLAWVTRVVFMVTIVISTFYVPIKAYFFWINLYSKDSTAIQFVIVLIFLFAAFVMPWLLTFFFEFKFLPAELSRLSTTQWTNWRVWCCPWMLVKPSPMQSTSAANRASTAISHSQPLARYSSMDTVFRTPMGSIRGSPPPVEHEELSLIREEGTDSPISTPLPECDQFSSENEQYTLCAAQAIEKLEQMTRSNNGWILEKEEDGIKCYSFRNNSHAKKIWKSETVINVAVEALWRVLYHETHRTTEWNTNVDVNEVVHHIDRTTDIVYTATKPVAMVTARDFVTVRKASVRRGCYYCASVSVTFIGKPPVPEKIRGDNGPCGYVLIPLDSTRTLFKWVIDSDMKGWIPQGIIDQNFTNTLVSANTNLRVLMNART